MVKYEMGVIIRADLPEDGFAVELDKVKALIDRFGGTIEKIDEWGRRRLAYPIEKQSDGIYYFITFSSDANAPKEIESRLRIMENLLRFLNVRKDEVEAPAVAETTAETTTEAMTAAEETPATATEEVAAE